MLAQLLVGVVLALRARGGKAWRLMEMIELTQRDKDILNFERSWWTLGGPKEALILDRFELSASRYYQILNELLESTVAYEYDPLVVRRLRRLRDRRRRQRQAETEAATSADQRSP